MRCVCFNDNIYSILKIKPEPDSRNSIDSRIIGDIKIELVEISNPLRMDIIQIMRDLELSYATMDVILIDEQNYSIVDVNPQGQYDDIDLLYLGMVSNHISQTIITANA